MESSKLPIRLRGACQDNSPGRACFGRVPDQRNSDGLSLLHGRNFYSIPEFRNLNPKFRSLDCLEPTMNTCLICYPDSCNFEKFEYS